MTKETHAELVTRLSKPLGQPMDAIHASFGMTTEAGEVADIIKGHMVYGRPLDTIHLVEELGDLLFFMEMMCQQVGVTMEELKESNMAKLNARYAEGYSDAAANNRKKEFEREAIRRAVWRDAPAPPALKQMGV